MSLANGLAGPITITFDPAVFTGGQTITLTGSELELSRPVPIFTITGPAAGVTISAGGLSGVFQIDKTVTAYISGLTISDAAGNRRRTRGPWAATLTHCVFTGVSPSSAAAIEVSGGTLDLTDSDIIGWLTGIQVVTNATAKITGNVISGNGTAIVVGSGSTDSCAPSRERNDLSGNTVGVMNNAGRPVDATFNWWGSSNGPSGAGAATATGNVLFSPWMGDAESLELTTPDALGFATASTAGNSYVVTPAPNGPSLLISQVGNPNQPWAVTPTGTVIFVGSGGTVTVNGQQGTDDFTLTNAAITFTAADPFNGATIEFNGNIGREVDAKGTTNDFDVSSFSGTARADMPDRGGDCEHGGVVQGGRLHTDQYVAYLDQRHEPDFERIHDGEFDVGNHGRQRDSDRRRERILGGYEPCDQRQRQGGPFRRGHRRQGGGTLQAVGSGNDVLIGGAGQTRSLIIAAAPTS